ncbi:MAG: hypothetical protein JWO28_3239 [Hyphomicrobiales bacterium]|nr:hypothetical protein [Hyphomicrobiales bacterium]
MVCCAFVESEGFAGRGEAWFGIEELQAFCDEIGAFPIPDRKPMLAGGYWSKDTPGVLDQTHVRIEMSPHGSKGLVSVAVQVATEAYFRATDLQQSLAVNFLVNYGDLARFQSALAAHLRGEAEEARLEALPS